MNVLTAIAKVIAEVININPILWWLLLAGIALAIITKWYDDNNKGGCAKNKGE